MTKRTRSMLASSRLRKSTLYSAVAAAALGLAACEAETDGEADTASQAEVADVAGEAEDTGVGAAAGRATGGETGQAAADPAVGPACWTGSSPAELAERASPLDSASVVLEAGPVKVCYGRPQMRGREIMGALVPFDQPWRLGANEATTISVPAAATIAGVEVEPGRYSLYTIPGEQSWDIVINAEPQRWGIPIGSEVRAEDVGSGRAEVTPTATPVEVLTISLDRTSANAAEMVIEWEGARVTVPVVLTGSGDAGSAAGGP